MKRFVLAVLGFSVAVGLVAYLNRPTPPQVASAKPAVKPAPVQTSAPPQPVKPLVARTAQQAAEDADSSGKGSVASKRSTSGKSDASIVAKSIDILVSPKASFEQKQAAWKQLREAGKLDQAISELEQRAANDPHTADYPAALGQAYLQKCATLQDVREQGILAMQADKVFDTALNLDPSNWEARFTKAVAMSYWPANLNKGEEVIQHFQALVQQQEAQAPQPQFAETYAWLGDQYQKAGRAADARAVWTRGATLFPESGALKTKLASAP